MKVSSSSRQVLGVCVLLLLLLLLLVDDGNCCGPRPNTDGQQRQRPDRLQEQWQTTRPPRTQGQWQTTRPPRAQGQWQTTRPPRAQGQWQTTRPPRAQGQWQTTRPPRAQGQWQTTRPPRTQGQWQSGVQVEGWQTESPPSSTWGPSGDTTGSQQESGNGIRQYGDLTQLGLEVKDCAKEPPRRVVGKKERRRRNVTRCDIDVMKPDQPVHLVEPKRTRATCGVSYMMYANTALRVKPLQGPESTCEVLALAANDTKLKVKCRRMRLKDDCDKEYLYITDGVQQQVTCGPDKPATVKFAGLIYLLFERNEDVAVDRSTLSCVIVAKAMRGGGGSTGPGNGTGGGSTIGTTCSGTDCTGGGSTNGTTCSGTDCTGGGSTNGTTCSGTDCTGGGSTNGTTCSGTDCTGGGSTNGTTCSGPDCTGGGSTNGTTCSGTDCTGGNDVKEAGEQLPGCDQVCGTSQIDTGIRQRIVGGSAAEQNEYPWMVRLIIRDGSFSYLCGASVITKTHLLTAAHCVNFRQPVVHAVLGDHDTTVTEPTSQQITASSVKVHPDYNSNTMNNDIALIRLSSELVFNKEVQPVCLGRRDRQYDGADVIVTGWGSTLEGGSVAEVLQEVLLNVVPPQQCQEDYRGLTITDGMVCASKTRKDSCQGDSGGPMVRLDNGLWYQLGVVSFGIGCANPNYPGVYARVTHYLDWISQEVTADGGSCQ